MSCEGNLSWLRAWGQRWRYIWNPIENYNCHFLDRESSNFDFPSRVKNLCFRDGCVVIFRWMILTKEDWRTINSRKSAIDKIWNSSTWKESSAYRMTVCAVFSVSVNLSTWPDLTNNKGGGQTSTDRCLNIVIRVQSVWSLHWAENRKYRRFNSLQLFNMSSSFGHNR